jgi:hypothetical protein
LGESLAENCRQKKKSIDYGLVWSTQGAPESLLFELVSSEEVKVHKKGAR